MSRTCPQCGNMNSDEVKFCTSCGNSMISSPDQSGLPIMPRTMPAAAGTQPDHGRMPKVLVVAVIAILVIIAALVILQVSGTFRVFPSAAPAVTSPATLAPEVIPIIPGGYTGAICDPCRKPHPGGYHAGSTGYQPDSHENGFMPIRPSGLWHKLHGSHDRSRQLR